MTAWHLRILMFFESPREWGDRNGIEYPDWPSAGRGRVLEHYFSELVGQEIFYDLIVRDLYARGMIVVDSLKGMVSGNSMFDPLVTGIGRQFIQFITSPQSF